MFLFIARRAGDHWKLTDEEALAIGEATLNLWDALPIPELQSALAKALAVYASTLSTLVTEKFAEGGMQARKRVYLAQGMTDEQAEAAVVDEMLAYAAMAMGTNNGGAEGGGIGRVVSNPAA